MRVLLISGHGDGDSGATGNGYKEANLTVEVVQKMKPLLSEYADITLYPVERNAFKDIQKGQWQVGWNFDYVLEIHFNAGGGTGSEIYVTSQERTTIVEQKILSNMGLFYRSRGVKVTDFLVIKTVKNHGISSALLEVCFIDNQLDMDVYEKSKDKICASIVAGIVEGFGITKGNNGGNNANNNMLSTSYRGDSLVDALKEIRVNSTFDYRKALAIKNGISNYTGTAQQNTALLNLLKQGQLKK